MSGSSPAGFACQKFTGKSLPSCLTRVSAICSRFFHSPEPPNQYSSKEQSCLVTAWLRAPPCPPAVLWNPGSPLTQGHSTTAPDALRAGVFNLWVRRVLLIEYNQHIKKKNRIEKSECVPEAIAIVWGNLFTDIHNACG